MQKMSQKIDISIFIFTCLSQKYTFCKPHGPIQKLAMKRMILATLALFNGMCSRRNDMSLFLSKLEVNIYTILLIQKDQEVSYYIPHSATRITFRKTQNIFYLNLFNVWFPLAFRINRNLPGKAPRDRDGLEIALVSGFISNQVELGPLSTFATQPVHISLAALARDCCRCSVLIAFLLDCRRYFFVSISNVQCLEYGKMFKTS